MSDTPPFPEGDALSSAQPSDPRQEDAQAEAEPSGLVAVVGIGGSAGALDGYERFFLGLQSGNGLAFVVVPHQSPASRGLMPELLQRCTPMQVSEIANGTVLEPDQVYVSPPGQDVTVEHGVLSLHPGRRAVPGNDPLPIDRFFESLALNFGSQAVAVVLSGMGQDGARGVQAIEAAGGLVLVQDPATAEYPSMPASAVMTGAVHHVLPSEELGARLQGVLNQHEQSGGQHHVSALAGGVLAPDLEQDGGLRSPLLQTILLLVRAQTGHDFTGYKHSTMIRRVHRRMQTHGLGTLVQYARYLRENPGEVRALYKDLTINVTSFFRDPDAFASLTEQLRLLLTSQAQSAGEDTFRVWTPGCSTGEEAYSLAIILRELLSEMGELHRIRVQIFATDIDEDSLTAARSGVYSNRISYVVSPERLERFFTAREDGYQIRGEIRDMVVFALHNTFGDPPFTRLDLVCCRNMLIYLGGELQRQLIPLFHYTLKSGGLLFLGPSETTGNVREQFLALDSQWKIFQRGPGPSQPLSLKYDTHVTRTAQLSQTEPAVSYRPMREAEVSHLVNSLLLSEYTPPSVVVTPIGEIVHVVGSTGSFLELALGRVGTNVLEMARDGLRAELSRLLRQAVSEHRETRQRHLRVQIDGVYREVDLMVRPLTLPRLEQSLLLIVFKLMPLVVGNEQSEGAESPLGEAQLAVIREMERELKYSRDYLQANVEEMEVSLEQLRSTNEELQTSNEELQSSNEELMTSKEELQSLNEELLTVNTEHQMMINDLAQANDDMKNLLDSAGIATVFLDNNLRIKRFTPRITEVIHLIPGDVGRPITQIVSNLRYDRLEHDVTEVLRTLTPLETEVQSRDEQWFLMKIAPYRTYDNFINGVVVVFTSITTIKWLERRMQESVLYADEAINAFPDPFIVLDTDLRLVSANHAFYTLLRLTPQGATGQPLTELSSGPKNFRALEEALSRVARGEGGLTDYAAEFDVPFAGRRIMKFTSRHLQNPDTQTGLVLLTMEDVTDLLHETEQVGTDTLLAEHGNPAGEVRKEAGEPQAGAARRPDAE